MKNNFLTHLSYIVLVVLAALMLLVGLKKTKIYTETVVVQSLVNDAGKISQLAILLNQNKINVSEIRYLTLYYTTGPINFDQKHLQYQDGLLVLTDINLNNIQSFRTTAALFGKTTYLINYLFSSLY